MVKNKKVEKIFIKEALGTRNYFSYRMDLMLYKIILSVLVGIAIYIHTSDRGLSAVIGAEVFAIFTLVNKLTIKGFLFEKNGFRNFVKKGSHMYLAEKDGLINCIKIYKLYDSMELEKIDVRNLISFMCKNNIRIGYLVTTGKLSEEAKKLLDEFKEKLDIHIVGMDELFFLMEQNRIFPENKYFYNKLCEEKVFEEKKKILVKNIFGSKKVLVYILASVFFYITSVFMPENVINRYIAYYFILLTAISVGCIIWNKYISHISAGDKGKNLYWQLIMPVLYSKS